MICKVLKGLAMAFAMTVVITTFFILATGAVFYIAPVLVLGIGGMVVLGLMLRVKGCIDRQEFDREMFEMRFWETMWWLNQKAATDYMVYKLWKKLYDKSDRD